jgi:hypothetical protein
MNTGHLNALRLRLSHLRCAPDSELGRVWIAQCEREIAGEEEFLAGAELSDDGILAELLK